MPRFEKSIFWQTVQEPGAEVCTLSESESGWIVSGTVLTMLDGIPTEVRYQIACDTGWVTRGVHVTERLGDANLELHLESDGTGRWHGNGNYVPALDGSVDVDLEVTPATNTLPIGCMQLSIGETAEIQAAWVRFPELMVESASQRYTHLDEQRYVYESQGGLYSAMLDVDELGLATRYGDIWIRNAATTAVPLG